MFFHLSVETFYVNADVSLFRKFHGYLKRKPISGKKHKSVSAGDVFSGKFFKSGKPFGKGLPEFLLLNRNSIFNLPFFLCQFRIDTAINASNFADERGKGVFGKPEPMRVPRRTADEPPDDVATLGMPRSYAIANQEDGAA